MCTYDPFPVDRDTRTFSTPWLRHASVLSRAKTCGDDASDVLTLLQKLSIQAEEEGLVDLGRTLLKPCTGVDVGFMLTPPPAPLPALHTPTTSSPISSSQTHTKRPSLFVPSLVPSNVASKVRSYAVRLGSAARRRCLSRKSKPPPFATTRLSSEPSIGRAQQVGQMSFVDVNQRPSKEAAPTLGPAFIWHPYPRGKPFRSTSRQPQRRATNILGEDSKQQLCAAPSSQPSSPLSLPSSKSPLSPLTVSSRLSSVASIRSVSSLTSSSSSSESELLLTPPLAATTLPDLQEVKDSPSFGLYADADRLPSVDMVSPCTFANDYVGYSSMLPHADDASLLSTFVAFLESKTSLIADNHFVRPIAPIAVF